MRTEISGPNMLNRMASARMSIAAISIDCHDHQALAAFYVALLDGEQMWSTATATGVRCGKYVLIMQQVDEYEPPRWPGSSIVHLDLNVNGSADIHEPTGHAVALGARVADAQPDPRWTVLLDPAGHPFCLTPFSPDK